MKVKELIELLSQEDQESEVGIKFHTRNTWIISNDIFIAFHDAVSHDMTERVKMVSIASLMPGYELIEIEVRDICLVH